MELKRTTTDPQRQQTRYRAERRLAELKPHEYNKRLYGDEPVDADLVASIQARGILEDIVILPDGTILSGHRRHRAALQAGLVTASVVVRSDLPEAWQQAGAIVEYNRQRVKTEHQIGQEMKAALWAEGGEAHLRQKATQFQAKPPPTASESDRPHGVRKITQTVETAKNAEKGRASGKVGKDFGVSGSTVERQVQVVDEIDRLTSEGRTEEAEQLKQTLNREGVSAAHRALPPKADAPAPPRQRQKPRQKPQDRTLQVKANPADCAAVLRRALSLKDRAALVVLLAADVMTEDAAGIRRGDYANLDAMVERYLKTRYPSTP